jgi:hypothetical protein
VLFYVFVLFVAVGFCVVRGRVFLFGDDASQTEQLKRNLCFHSNSVCCVFKVLQMLYAFFPFVFTNHSNEIFVFTKRLTRKDGFTLGTKDVLTQGGCSE